MIRELIQKIKEEYWTDKVKLKWDPPKGTFTADADPAKSAKIICDGHKGDFKTSVDCVMFFRNRTGMCDEKSSHYNKKWCDTIEKIKSELDKICKKKGSEK